MTTLISQNRVEFLVTLASLIVGLPAWAALLVEFSA